MFVWGKNMTSDTGAQISFVAGQEVECASFQKRSILVWFTDTFDSMDWPSIHHTFHDEVPRLFQVSTCKQVMVITTSNKNMRRQLRDGRSLRNVHGEQSQWRRQISHIVRCPPPEAGRVQLLRTVQHCQQKHGQNQRELYYLLWSLTARLLRK